LERNASGWQWFYQRNKKDGGSPGLLIINHPFADFRIPGFGTYDAHWHFEGSDSGMQKIMNQSYDGIEVFHLPTHAAEHVLGRSGKDTAIEKAFALLDADALRRRERLRAFAGIDNHHTFNPLLMPLMHVFAVTRTREAIYDALFKGHITLLGTDAFTFRACGDKDKSWVMTGGDVHADREVIYAGAAERSYLLMENRKA
jgi:hypothetical protein